MRWHHSEEDTASPRDTVRQRERERQRDNERERGITYMYMLAKAHTLACYTSMLYT